MKYKILCVLLSLAVLGGTYALIRYLPADLSVETKEPQKTETQEPEVKPSDLTRTYVVETAYDVEEWAERLAYGENKDFSASLADLVTRLKNSSEYLKNELEDYYGASYFSTIGSILENVKDQPFSDSSDFSARVGKMLTELENAYPTDIAGTLNPEDPENPMYYPKFETSVNGSFSLAMLSVYRQQYQKNNNCILLSFGGNLLIGDALLDGDDEDSFKNLSSKSKYAFPLYGLSSVLSTDHASFANLETPLTESIGSAETANALKGLPSYAKLLKKGGLDVISIANDAILSMGDSGKSDTISALNAADVQVSDEGTIRYHQTALGSVAYLTYNIIDEIKGSVNQAFEEIPKADIAKAREKGAKFVVVHFNWVNTETRDWDPCMNQVLTTRAAVDNGADLVLGTHPNSIESIEIYKGVSIVYSPGNLSNKNGSGASSFLFQQAFALDDSGKAVRGSIQVFPLSGASEGNGVPSLVLDAAGAKNFSSSIQNASSTVRYGIGRNDSLSVSLLNLISIQK